MRKNVILFLLVFIGIPVYAKNFKYKYGRGKYVYHLHNESSYQHAYCSMHAGIEEYKLPDKTRVDCLTDKYAIEFDFANKKYEAVTQALWYGMNTGKLPNVILILDNKYQDKQMIYYERIKKIGEVYNFEVEYITNDILNIDETGKCPYIDCKCRRKKKNFLQKLFKLPRQGSGFK